MRYLRCATLILAGVMSAVLPASAQVQSSKTVFQHNYADVNGMRLHYASIGKGPLVLFLHGYPSFWYQWKDQMAEMGKDHLAVGLDMRGYNLSSRPEGLEPYKMKHLVEDVRQFAEKIAGKDKKFTLVAHDWGANVAWVFAMLPSEPPQRAIQRSAPGVDDSNVLVGEGSHRGREVNHHQRADLRHLGHEGLSDPFRSPQWPGEMGPEPQRQALSRR